MTGPRIVCLVGPTASGKSTLALELAERLGGEIVSADSRQVYRGLDVGTAKPTAAEQARVPHHCLDLVDPDEAFDAARSRAAATAALAGVVARGRAPHEVGATGRNLRLLVRGLCPAPPRVPALRAALGERAAREGAPALHRELASVDPAAAARIATKDAARIVRALEVARATGVPLSTWQERHRFAERPYEVLTIGLARPVPELDARIAARVREMVGAGLLDEVRALQARGLGAAAPGLRTVGYPEMLACLEGRTDLEAAIAATVLATRRFAKRQRTWFRREPGVRWRHPERERARIAGEVEDFLAGRGQAAAAEA
jgi:tRNA dimethylallyltransferase